MADGHGGARPGSGRHKGGCYYGVVGEFKSSLDFMMALINDPEVPLEMRVRAAVAALPFQHPKLAEATVTKKSESEEAANKVIMRRFAIPPAPSPEPRHNA